MSVELLTEHLTPSECGLITETTNKGNDVWLNGIYMQSEIENRNGRNYPLSEISSAVDVAMQRIKESNGIFGELDHPQTLNINLDRISHVITDLKMEGNNAVGKAKLIETPMGMIAKELVKSGVSLGVSSRGAGAVNESGGVTGFQFVTVDLVATPSAAGAVPTAVYESLMSSVHGKEIVSLSGQLQHDTAAQEYFKKAIMSFLKEDLFAKKR